MSSFIHFIQDKDRCNNINEHNNNIIIITTMTICINPVRRGTQSVSISPSGVPFIGNDTKLTDDNKYKIQNE